MNRRSWSRELVIAAIHNRQQRGLPLERTWQEDRLLHGAAGYYFGNWHLALAAAGLPSRPLRRWTQERVLAALRSRIEQRLPLETLWREDRGLHAAAIAYYGSWRNAKVAVGLNIRPYERWSRQRVLNTIRRRYRQGVSLVGVRGEDPRLHSAAARYFGSWTQAMAAAGVPLTRRLWTRESIIAAIQTHYARYAGRKRRVGNRALHCLASRRFGSWAAALAAAGFDYTPPRKWSRRRVIEAIRQRFQKGRTGASVWREDPGLGGAASRHFGSWLQALEAAGIEPPRRRWTAERVLAALKVTYPGMTGGIWKTDKGLAQATLKFFGTCQQAVTAAGLELRGKKWSRRTVIEAIQDRYVKRQPLTAGGTPQATALFPAATRQFGSWRKALAAAGVPHPRARQRWTPERVLREIRRAHARGGRLSEKRANRCLASAAQRYFGNWRNALQAAGIQCPRLPHTWDQQSLLDEIRSRHQRGLPVTCDENKDLAFAATRLFGNWTAALVAAGLKPHRIQWNKPRVIAEIRKRLQERRSLASSDPANFALAAAAAKLFGSWRTARQAVENLQPHENTVDQK